MHDLKTPPRVAALLKTMDAKLQKLQLPRSMGGHWSYYRLRSLVARTAGVILLILFLVYTLQPAPIQIPPPSRKIFRTANRVESVSPNDQTPSEVDRVQPIANTTETQHADEWSHAVDCGADTAHLRLITERHNLGDQLDYYKRYIRFTRQPIERKSYTNIQQKLIPGGLRAIDLNNATTHEPCGVPLEVPVTKSPFPSTADLSDYMFAISTTYDRLADPAQNMIKEWAYWLTDSNGRSNGGKLLLLVMGATDVQLDAFTNRLARAGIDADVSHSDQRLEMAVRYLNLVATLYRHKESSNKKWLVLCDDDTFFPSPVGLTNWMRKYNTARPMYVGTLSEDALAVQRHGSQAFGGAGVFITLPLARAISRIISTCKTDEKIQESDSGYGPQGDILLRKCIYENTSVRLTQLHHLWQLDLFGDAGGFYESGTRPLSVHHYRHSWHTAYPGHASKVAHTCGEDCTFQRFVTADGFVVSNGYSVAQYPEGIDFDLEQLEATWAGSNDPNLGWRFDLMLGPQRLSLHRTGRKLAWEMVEARNGADGSVTQVYIRRKDDDRWKYEGEPMRETDGVIELVWIPS